MAVTWTPSVSAAIRGVYRGSFGPTANDKFVRRSSASGKWEVTTKLTAAGTYTAGGDIVTAASLGLGTVLGVLVVADEDAGSTAAATGGGLFPQFDLTDPANPKLKLYSSASTETSGDITAKAFTFQFIGR